ncbi:RNA polymerase sigma-70 factor [uncultured Croceitalea sp.]|uniref:RNA polymerase sigma-70 factor n=1 Tax=uncultured Croceitalea sp. TaxID=1798908 RepID=UPI00374F8336
MDVTKHLFLLVKEGDEKAFRLLFDSLYPRLCAFSLNFVHEKFDTEEIVGDVFVKLWRKRGKLDKVEHPKSYLYRMCYNASMDFIKKKGNAPIRLNPKTHGTSTIMKELIIEEEVHSILFKAMDSLPKKCRRVFELSCIEGLRYKDIAEDLQISLNTVKSQRSRAIELLRVQLKDYSFLYLLLGLL